MLRPDGSVCTWGKAGYGAERSKVKPLLEAQKTWGPVDIFHTILLGIYEWM